MIYTTILYRVRVVCNVCNRIPYCSYAIVSYHIGKDYYIISRRFAATEPFVASPVTIPRYNIIICARRGLPTLPSTGKNNSRRFFSQISSTPSPLPSGRSVHRLRPPRRSDVCGTENIKSYRTIVSFPTSYDDIAQFHRIMSHIIILSCVILYYYARAVARESLEKRICDERAKSSAAAAGGGANLKAGAR